MVCTKLSSTSPLNSSFPINGGCLFVSSMAQKVRCKKGALLSDSDNPETLNFLHKHTIPYNKNSHKNMTAAKFLMHFQPLRDSNLNISPREERHCTSPPPPPPNTPPPYECLQSLHDRPWLSTKLVYMEWYA